MGDGTVITARVIVEGRQVFVLESPDGRATYVSWNGEAVGTWFVPPTVEQILDPTRGGTTGGCRVE